MPDASHIPTIVSGVIALLMIAAATLVLTRRLRFPFTVALVLIGLALSSTRYVFPATIPGLSDLEISPALILYVFLPVLIFESAFNLDARLLRRNLGPVLILAVPGLLLSTLLIGLIVTFTTNISLSAALLLGAILSATDPVAVISIFKRLGAPKRLTILVEGESLLNDATSIVLARIILAIVLAGHISGATALRGVVDFVLVFAGGLAVGILLGLIAGYLLGAVGSDLYLEITLTTILAYLSFILAEELLHVSGVTATLAAGLTVGSWGRVRISVPIRRHLEQFWAYIAFICNALIFLMVGLRVNLAALWANAVPLIWVMSAMLVSRAVVIYGLMPVLGRIPRSERIGAAYKAVMFWGGLRGAVALAIVLSLPSFSERETFVALVMGAVLFTLLVNGLTMEPLVKRVGLDRPPLADRFAQLEALFSAQRRAANRLPELLNAKLFNASIADRLREECFHNIDDTQGQIEALSRLELNRNQQRRIAFLRALAEERSAYVELFDSGQLTEAALRELTLVLDAKQDAMRFRGVHLVEPIRELRRHQVEKLIVRLLDRLSLTASLAERLRLRRVALDYDVAWGEYQASSRVLGMLGELSRLEAIPAPLLDEVKGSYLSRNERAQQQLDYMAEQFPEFVYDLQEQIGRRLVLLSELNSVDQQATAGTIPDSVADRLTVQFQDAMGQLHHHAIPKLKTSPEELLRTVPFLQNLSTEDFMVLTNRMRHRTFVAGEVIFRQGDPEASLYLIARGVVRITRKTGDDWRHIATLMAGNFFGEAAFLENRRRNATVTAMTACSLYELSRNNLEAVLEVYPGIRTALEKESERRKIGTSEVGINAR